MDDIYTLTKLSLTHRLGVVSENALQQSYDARHTELCAFEDREDAKREELLHLLSDLSTSDFGMSMLYHQGITGYWTHYMVLYPMMKDHPRYAHMGEFDRWLLERCPVIRATQQRFKHFLQAVKDYHKDFSDNVLTLASLPCGLMDDLLWLRGLEKETRLIGLDIDRTALQLAEQQAMYHRKRYSCSFFQVDAWQLGWHDVFHMVLSNGLIFYEPDDMRVIAFFERAKQALKQGGFLITSNLTPPPSISADCPWVADEVDIADARIQRLLFQYIIKPNFQAYRTSSQMQKLVEKAGLAFVEERQDKANMFPTYIIQKR